VLSVLASLFELISIAIMLPFIDLITNLNSDQPNLPEFLKVIKFIDFTDLRDVAIALIIFSLISSTVKIMLLYAINIISHRIGNVLAISLVRKICGIEYSELTKRKQTDLITSVWQRTNEVVYQTILPGISIVSALVIVIVNTSFFFFLEPFVTAQIFFSLAFIYVITFLIIRKQISIHGERISLLNEKLLAKLSFLFGRYRDLYVKNGFEKFVRDYLASDLNIRMSRAKVQIVGGLPKIVIETFFIILMGIFGLYSLNNTALSTSNIPFFITLLFGMQKLLPQIQQIYQSKVALQSGSHALNEIKIFLNLPDRKAEFGFGKLLDSTAAFELRNIGFKHSKGDEPQIADLNFKIYRGEKICISGKSGSGKSTLVDLLIGLYTPTSGELCAEPINLTNNQFTILSQHFHIDNDSIRNLLLANSKKHYSDENLFEILDIVKLGETIRALPGGLDYELLNDAQNLSGGQRQRLGLAMSLMDDFDVLILDEVTSQLDRTLEHQIYENLFNYYSSKTIIFITHTEHLKKLADRIIQLD
jgi:ATP-binding cassette, subfamily B, bacterial PglK